ncbi:MAG: M1 family aminopeptidase [Bacteroidota bacterium]|nr:M1 family aminopeptidase [Candidatus Kapabacteria bacterium]MDW8219306.1 M1 family aminopeptidase [Bacteroidota bacterium]
MSSTLETGADRQYTGTLHLQLILDSSLRTTPKPLIELDAHHRHIRIDSAYIDSTRADIALSSTFDDRVTLIPQRNIRVRDTIAVRLYFTHISTHNPEDGTGFLLYRQGRLGAIRTGNDSVFLPERLAYTMSQPYGTRRWIPCNDTPSDKAFVRISVRVPRGFLGIANGLLREHYQDSLGGEIFIWEHIHPIAPYLIAVTASRYSMYREWYRKRNAPYDSIPITHYFWQEDDTDLPLNNHNYNVRRSFQITTGAIAAYARYFGEYPFESYGHVVVQPFVAGGMEHQTISTINRAWLRGSSSAGIAHEIAHQWFGNSVTCASWHDIWLNEGTATYSEALWYESWGGRAWNMVAMYGFRRNYFNSASRLHTVYVHLPTSMDIIFNYATTYCKGAWIHHMLRRIYGDSVYFRAMRLFLQRHAFGTATTPDFAQAFKDVLGGNTPVPVSIDTFLHEWVYCSGEPILTASWRLAPQAYSTTSNTTYTIHGTLQQIQEGINIPKVFHLPVELSFWKYDTATGDTQRIKRTVIMHHRRESFTVILPFFPDSVVIDEADNLLCQKMPTVGPRRMASSAYAEVYPSPLQRSDALHTNLVVSYQGIITLEIVNTLGQHVQTLYHGFASSGLHSFQHSLNLSPGTYFLRCLLSHEPPLLHKFLVVP